MNQIVSMILRQITRRLVNKGVAMGIDKAASMRTSRQNTAEISDAEPLSPEQRQARREARQARRQAKQAKQSLRALRRASRF